MGELYEKIDAITDIPACSCFDVLFEVFPESKVILMERDEEALAKSLTDELREQWWRYYFLSFFSPTVNKYHRYVELACIHLYGTIDMKNENLLRKRSRHHNELVKLHIPEDQ